MVCKRSQHVGPNNVASCWPTMLRVFARALIFILALSGLDWVGTRSQGFSSADHTTAAIVKVDETLLRDEVMFPNQIHSMTLILWHLHCSFSFEVMAELSHPDQRFLLEKFLEDINVPTLTLWGDKDKVRRNTFDWDVWNTRISCLYTSRVPTVQELVSTSFPGSSLFPPKRE